MLAILLLVSLLLTGCGKLNKDTRIVLTTGFQEDEVFRIDTASCYKREVMVYLCTLQNRYESVFGRELWQISRNDTTPEESLVDSVISMLAQIKTMNLMAKERGIELAEEEEKIASEAAKEYFSLLTKEQVTEMDVTVHTIEQLYREYLLAEKLYNSLIADINPEISDDEARIVSLVMITFEEGHEDKLQECLNRIEEGEDFELLAGIYNEEGDTIVFLEKGEADPIIEDVAFNLARDEVSQVVHVPGKMIVMKCLSTFDRDETEANKTKILAKRREDTFTGEYNRFLEKLNRSINEEVRDSITLPETVIAPEKDFFQVFDEHK